MQRPPHRTALGSYAVVLESCHYVLSIPLGSAVSAFSASRIDVDHDMTARNRHALVTQALPSRRGLTARHACSGCTAPADKSEKKRRTREKAQFGTELGVLARFGRRLPLLASSVSGEQTLIALLQPGARVERVADIKRRSTENELRRSALCGCVTQQGERRLQS